MTFRPWRRLVVLATGVLLVGALLVVLGDALGRPEQAADGRVEPSPAPELRGTGLDGKVHDLAELDGDVVLVNVWASWCAPCRAELPLLAAAARRHHDEGLRLIGINTDADPRRARRLLDEVDARDTVHLTDREGTLAVDWGVRGIPETFVVDTDGRVVARHSGEVSAEWLTSVVLPLLHE